MTPSLPPQDLAGRWTTARKLYPLYVELAREFVIDLPSCADFEAGEEQPDREGVERAVEWLTQMDKAIQVYQLRQFLQTGAMVDQQCMLALLQHFLAQPTKEDSARDKVDFLLVQYFSQVAPSGLDDDEGDFASVAPNLAPAL